jgi:UDP-N-acetylglucosamine 3-dehydrogenase
MLGALPDARLIACADIDPQRSADCPPGVLFSTNLEAALDAEGVQAVIVATPPDAHRHAVEAAAARGLAILCEKPLAGSLEDGDAMQAASQGTGVFVVGHIYRFEPRYRAVQAALASGSLGELVSIKSWLNSDLSEQAYYAPRSTLAREMAVHHLDVFRWLGGDITRISGATARWRGLEAALVATVRFRSGAVGTLQVSWAHPEGSPFDHGISLIGSAGLAGVDDDGGASIPEALRNELTTFLDCARGRAGWPLEVSDARAALALSLALQEAVTTGAVVELPDAGVGGAA